MMPSPPWTSPSVAVDCLPNGSVVIIITSTTVSLLLLSTKIVVKKLIEFCILMGYTSLDTHEYSEKHYAEKASGVGAIQSF
jgi:hypothetical protein